MAPAPTLSVILPNFNHAHFLPRAIEALTTQDRPADEIVIVDDGSTDNSRSVIESIAARLPSVRALFNEKNQGAIPALKRGIDAATGRYIYLAAADDWVLPGFFSAALAMLAAHPEAGLFCGEVRLVDGQSNSPIGFRPPVRPVAGTRFVPPDEARALLKRIDNWILTSTTLFRRDFVVAAGGLNEKLGSFGDGMLARKIALSHGFCFAPRIFACWAIFSGGYSRKTALDLDRARQFLDIVPAYIASDPVFPKWYAELFAKRWRFATSRLALEADPPDHAFVEAMGARSALDRRVMRTTQKLLSPHLARTVTLAWLWMRLRPTALTGLARTALARQLGKPGVDDSHMVPVPEGRASV